MSKKCLKTHILVNKFYINNTSDDNKIKYNLSIGLNKLKVASKKILMYSSSYLIIHFIIVKIRMLALSIL